jgi:hypothetical protein
VADLDQFLGRASPGLPHWPDNGEQLGGAKRAVDCFGGISSVKGAFCSADCLEIAIDALSICHRWARAPCVCRRDSAT